MTTWHWLEIVHARSSDITPSPSDEYVITQQCYVKDTGGHCCSNHTFCYLRLSQWSIAYVQFINRIVGIGNCHLSHCNKFGIMAQSQTSLVVSVIFYLWMTALSGGTQTLLQLVGQYYFQPLESSSFRLLSFRESPLLARFIGDWMTKSDALSAIRSTWRSWDVRWPLSSANLYHSIRQ